MTKLAELPNIFESATIKPSFKEVHVLLALIVFNEEENKDGIGRYRLKRDLNLPEGKVKSLLNRMKQMDLIHTDSRITGHIITDNGKSMIDEFFQSISEPKIPPFDYEALTVGDFGYYSIVTDARSKIGTGMEQRDEVIKIGGTGATCLVYDQGKLHFPKDSENIKVEIDLDTLEKKITNKDVLVIGTGPSKSIARIGTLSAALSLVNLW